MNRIISSIYHPYTRGANHDLNHYLPDDRTIYFAYGRQALEAALLGLGLKVKEEILVPEFICTEVLDPFQKHHLKPVYYKVSEDLVPDYAQINELISDTCKTLLIVNYFGFPQSWGPIRAIQNRHGVVVIEDNAHGFLSNDPEKPLGLRGDLGIFSLRKTVSLPSGGALTISNPKFSHLFKECQLSMEGFFLFDKQTIKYFLKEMSRPFMGIAHPTIRNFLLRRYRNLQNETDDNLLESPARFSLFAKKRLMNNDFQKEVARRRRLFEFFEARFRCNNDCKPIFSNLPEKVCPYGYPFYYRGSNMNSFIDSLLNEGIPALLWPELPTEVKNRGVEYYNKLVLIPFLW
jgi:hypothetical protein